MLDFAPDGAPLGVYCNVALPPILGPGRLDWVDLDLDVVRSGDGPATLVGEDEFAAHAARYAYPAALVASARAAADELLALASAGSRHSSPRTGIWCWPGWRRSCGATPSAPGEVGAMRLILVRHGASHHSAAGLIAMPRGCTGLTDTGVAQVDALARRTIRHRSRAGL